MRVAGFGFVGDKALEKVAPFSGGEKSRLVLALLVGAAPAYLVPLYFSTASASEGLHPWGILYYTTFWGGGMSLILLLAVTMLTELNTDETRIQPVPFPKNSEIEASLV